MNGPVYNGVLSGPYAKTSPAPMQSPAQQIVDQFGRPVPVRTDPAWQPPQDPLRAGNLQQRATVIAREIPNLSTQIGWEIAQVRSALESLQNGLFDASSQLVDAVVADSRVQSAMASRSGGLLGRPLRHQPAKHKNKDLAKKVCKAWVKRWPVMAPEAALSELQQWSVMQGFGAFQLLWDTTSTKYWTPMLSVFHPRYTYWDWTFRCYVAITMDGQMPIIPGDGHWGLHAPHGPYRGWMRSAIRAISPWWLARNYALRDWARYSERHGMPILKAIVPFGADAARIAEYRQSLSTLGQESVIQVPQSGDPNIGGYDLEFLEASDQAWLAFLGLITQCNAEITLSLLGQNLTTEVKEGSFAAARVHADVRQAILESDARSLERTIYTQIARPFAALNFGDPSLAPITTWDVAPYEDNKVAADTLVSFATAVASLKTAGVEIKQLVAFARTFGLDLSRADIGKAAAPTVVAAPAPGTMARVLKLRDRGRVALRKGDAASVRAVLRDMSECIAEVAA